MIAIRAVLAAAMMIVGGVVIVRMLPYGISRTFTGIALGLAMMALGAYRLHQIYHRNRSAR